MRYNINYQYRLWPRSYKADTKWSLSGLLELNGDYQDESEQDGRSIKESERHQIFLSPGVALYGKRMRYEAGMQFLIVRDVGDFAPEDDTRIVMGATFTF